jgi:hypothetical protein
MRFSLLVGASGAGSPRTAPATGPGTPQARLGCRAKCAAPTRIHWGACAPGWRCSGPVNRVSNSTGSLLQLTQGAEQWVCNAPREQLRAAK